MTAEKLRNILLRTALCTLYIPVQNVGELALTLPIEYAFDTVTISVNQSHLYAEGHLSAEKLNLDLGEGEATLEGLSVSESCAVNIKRSSAFLSGTLAGTVEAQCNEGQIQIQTSGQQTNFNYNLELSDASVQIEDEIITERFKRRLITAQKIL